MERGKGVLRGSDAAVHEALLSAGWHEGRNVDTSRWVAELTDVGYTPHTLSLRIWAEFGNLTIRSMSTRTPSYSLYIEPVDACIDSYEESVRLCDRYGEIFSPLGMWSVQFRSYVSASGRVVAVPPFAIVELGASFSEALEYVVKGEGIGSRDQPADWPG